jgi:hypothetical protein
MHYRPSRRSTWPIVRAAASDQTRPAAQAHAGASRSLMAGGQAPAPAPGVRRRDPPASGWDAPRAEGARISRPSSVHDARCDDQPERLTPDVCVYRFLVSLG